MRNLLQISVLSGMLAMSGLAIADTTASTNAPAMSMMDVLNKLDAAGYSAIKEVELESNGNYKVETINAKGEKIEFIVDSNKPVIEPGPKNMKILTASEVAKKVMDAGYMNITKVKFQGDSYDVKAQDKDGKMVRLDVNLMTGAISKDWF